jgi:pseudouridine-5'-phosphate glycosidase
MNPIETLPSWIELHPDVHQGLRTNQPVVALETTVITHGLPRPMNFELGIRMHQEVRNAGAVPATIALLEGTYHIGLSDSQLEHLALESNPVKINRRELGIQRALKGTGGTTVAATMYLAHLAEISVFATGGIGGIHRGQAGDVSADLPELANTPVAVVCSGAKAILDLPRTLEWLETYGVPVLGWQSDTFPEFFSAGGSLPVQVRVDNAGEAAKIVRQHWDTGLKSGVLICVPCPEADAVPAELVEATLQEALSQADTRGIAGKDVSPFLLTFLSEASDGATVEANTSLLRNNARIAAELAGALVSQSP